MLAACSSDDSEKEPEVTDPLPSPIYDYNVNAVFFKGLVSGADCYLYSLDNNGIQSNLIKNSTTNEEGLVSFKEINYKGTALIECSKGIYVDEATERMVENKIEKIRTVVLIDGAEKEINTVLSPLTEMAIQVSEFNTTDLNSVLTTYNDSVSTAFGLDNLDISKVVPLDLLNNVVSEDSQEASYAFTIALIAGITLNKNEVRSLEDIISALSIDLNRELDKTKSTFSEIKRSELGESAAFYLEFGSLVNSSLQDTDIRQSIIEKANLTLPVSTEVLTDSLRYPIEQIRTELVEYIINKDLRKVPSAPFVSDEMYKLGQSLAFDKILSGNKDTSCLSCHHPLLGTGDNRSLPLGTGGKNLGQDRVGGSIVPRHAPTLFNLDLFKNMFWDGRVQFNEEQKLSTPADSSGDLTDEMEKVFFAKMEVEGFQGYGLVSAQAMFPVTSTEEMRGEHLEGNELAQYSGEDFKEIWEALMVRLGDIPEYITLFESAYPNVKFETMTFAHAANAIAAFEIKAFDFRETPWQAVINDVESDGIWDNQNQLNEETTRGAHFFFETGCSNCHSGAVMSDFDFHNITTAQFGTGKGDGNSGFEDFGRERVTGNIEDRTKFRTAPLFNVSLTAPYSHLGQFNNLWSHIQTYAVPERFWLNIYTGYDRVREGFVHKPTFEEEISESEKILLKEIPLPSFDNEKHGFIKTIEYIENKLLRVENDKGRLTLDEGKKLGAGELNAQRQVLVPFMNAQTDPRARRLEGVIPDSVPSGLSVEKELLEE
jgi:cytochrome c peroxidase